MNKSTSGSMFEGFNLFGKTNSNFSLTQSYQPSSGSRTNYQFESESMVLPPPAEGFTALPSSINDDRHHDRDMPPQNFPTSSLKRDQKNALPQEFKSLPKSWVLNEPPDRVRTPSKTELVPLSNAKFTNKGSLSGGRTSPPPITEMESIDNSLLQSTESLKSSSMDSFFNCVSEDVNEFKDSVIKLKSEHDSSVLSQKREMDAIEGSIKAISLAAIQELVEKEQRSARLVEFEAKIKHALQKNDFTAAEKLQMELDSQNTNNALLIFELPSENSKNKENINLLSKSSRMYVNLLKSFCVSLDGYATKFRGISKKLDVRCSTKLDKQKQNIEALTYSIICKEEHLAIDKDYNNKQKQTLEAENKITMKSLLLQIDCQDEMLQHVQEQIKELEEQLNKLKSQEVTILDEKRQLMNEKSNYEKECNQRLLQLESESEKLHIKFVSVDHEKAVLRERQDDYEKTSTKLDNVNNSLEEVTSILNTFKRDACETISQEEARIIKEIQTDVQMCNLATLQLPSELTDLMTKIILSKDEVDDLSNHLFELQKSMITMKNKKSLLESNLENCRSLKEQAVDSKKYQEAALLTGEEATISANMVEVSQQIENAKHSLSSTENALNYSRSTLNDLQSKALFEQQKFDGQCFSVISEKLRLMIDQLAALPEAEVPAKKLLRFDISYMYWYTKVIQARNTDLIINFTEDQNASLDQLSVWIEEQLANVRNETNSIKVQINEAISSERFDEAETLNEKFEILHGKQ